jgi:hypothetical protein
LPCSVKLNTISKMCMQVVYPLPKMFVMRVLQISEYLHIPCEIPWGWNPSLYLKLADVSYTPYSLKVIFYSISKNCVHDRTLNDGKFIILAVLKVWSLGVFQILDFC